MRRGRREQEDDARERSERAIHAARKANRELQLELGELADSWASTPAGGGAVTGGLAAEYDRFADAVREVAPLGRNASQSEVLGRFGDALAQIALDSAVTAGEVRNIVAQLECFPRQCDRAADFATEFGEHVARYKETKQKHKHEVEVESERTGPSEGGDAAAGEGGSAEGGSPVAQKASRGKLAVLAEEMEREEENNRRSKERMGAQMRAFEEGRSATLRKAVGDLLHTHVRCTARALQLWADTFQHTGDIYPQLEGRSSLGHAVDACHRAVRRECDRLASSAKTA